MPKDARDLVRPASKGWAPAQPQRMLSLNLPGAEAGGRGRGPRPRRRRAASGCRSARRSSSGGRTRCASRLFRARPAARPAAASGLLPQAVFHGLAQRAVGDRHGSVTSAGCCCCRLLLQRRRPLGLGPGGALPPVLRRHKQALPVPVAAPLPLNRAPLLAVAPPPLRQPLHGARLPGAPGAPLAPPRLQPAGLGPGLVLPLCAQLLGRDRLVRATTAATASAVSGRRLWGSSADERLIPPQPPSFALRSSPSARPARIRRFAVSRGSGSEARWNVGRAEARARGGATRCPGRRGRAG
jgi:hypothetical protein